MMYQGNETSTASVIPAYFAPEYSAFVVRTHWPWMQADLQPVKSQTKITTINKKKPNQEGILVEEVD
jgi:hypothetical protein